MARSAPSMHTQCLAPRLCMHGQAARVPVMAGTALTGRCRHENERPNRHDCRTMRVQARPIGNSNCIGLGIGLCAS